MNVTRRSVQVILGRLANSQLKIDMGGSSEENWGENGNPKAREDIRHREGQTFYRSLESSNKGAHHKEKGISIQHKLAWVRCTITKAGYACGVISCPTHGSQLPKFWLH
jgi:hypothetical protein